MPSVSAPPALEKIEKREPPPRKRASASRPNARRANLTVPPILLEGDAAPPPRQSGPGARYALSPTAPKPIVSTPVDLPEAYGTGKVFVTARDPHWLYVTWDFTREQQLNYNAESRDGHLVVRVHLNDIHGPSAAEVHVHPESRNWFVFVGKAETRYSAELGYYDETGSWKSVGISQSTFTPPDALAEDTTAEFTTIPAEVPFQRLIEVVHEFIEENVPLVEAIERAREEKIEAVAELPPAVVPSADQTKFEPEPPRTRPHNEHLVEPEPQVQSGFQRPVQSQQVRSWTPARAAELAAMVTMDSLRRVWMGSLEITELIRRRLQKDISSIAAAELARGAEVTEIPGGVGAISSVSSPFGGVPGKGRKFWFNINAELIIYGATEPDAKVSIGDRQIALRSDGSFSYRFALPDGRFELPITANSSDREESRLAALRFSRFTDYRGQVDAHPQDAGLKTPEAKNV
jgi:hypothetical protein